MKRVLVINTATGGESYNYRTFIPFSAFKKEEQNNPGLSVELSHEYKLERILEKGYTTVYFHGSLGDIIDTPGEIKKLKNQGINVVMDVDSYWHFPKDHPAHAFFSRKTIQEAYEKAISMADCVSVATPPLMDQVMKFNKNVALIPSAIDLSYPQYNVPKTESDRFRFGWVGNQNSLSDLLLLEDTFQKVGNEKEFMKTAQFHLAGFNVQGTIEEKALKQEFVEILKRVGLFKKEIVEKIKRLDYNIGLMLELPERLRQDYPICFDRISRKVRPEETIWAKFENILTHNHKIITDGEYKSWLERYSNTKYQGTEGEYVRHFKKSLSNYATVYSNFDALLLPQRFYGKNENSPENIFQQCRDVHGILEAGAYRLPVITSEAGIGHSLWDNLEALKISNKRQTKDWLKTMKFLVKDNDSYLFPFNDNVLNNLNPKRNLRSLLGDNLRKYVEKNHSITLANEIRKEILK